MKISTFLVIVSFILIGCKDISGSANDFVSRYSCFDSDGGINYEIYGYVNYISKKIINKKFEDKCLESSKIKEFYCKKNKVSSLTHSCENGCYEGRCIPKPQFLVVPEVGIYLGAWNQDGKGRKLFEDLIGDKAPLWTPSFAGGCADESGNEGTIPKINIKCREDLFAKGYATSYGIEAAAQNGEANSTIIDFTNKITPQDIIDGKVDAQLKEIAKQIAVSGKPIFWRYHREPFLQFGGYGPDGTWTLAMCDYHETREPFCNPKSMFGDINVLDGPERYIAMHKRIHDVVEGEIKQIGLQSTIIWVMGSVSEGERKIDGFYKSYYPGNDYVDWHSFNWYPDADNGCPQGYNSISQDIGWKEAMELASDKPVLILEFGVPAVSDGCNRVPWFKSFFNDVHDNTEMKNLKGLIYWQESLDTNTGNYENLNTVLPQTNEEVEIWENEINENPQYWVSQLKIG